MHNTNNKCENNWYSRNPNYKLQNEFSTDFIFEIKLSVLHEINELGKVTQTIRHFSTNMTLFVLNNFIKNRDWSPNRKNVCQIYLKDYLRCNTGVSVEILELLNAWITTSSEKDLPIWQNTALGDL